jgi:hypothetical protein
MENGGTIQGEGKDPSSFLSEIIGNPVTVKLNSGVVYKGIVKATLTVSVFVAGSRGCGSREKYDMIML